MVMVSHSMDDVARLATRVVVLEQGTIAMTGAPHEVFSQVERLTQMGLDVPAVSRLAHQLRAHGLPIPECYLMEEMAEALENLLKRGGPDVA